MNNKFGFASSLVFTALLAGCGGGSNSSDSDIQVQEGYFRDAPVIGLSYETETQSGTTGQDGSYHYIEGERVTFSVGSLTIGQATASPILTPIEITSFLSPSALDNINIVRVLMMLDEDRNPHNGIVVSEVLKTALGESIDASNIDIRTTEGADELQILLSQVVPGLDLPTNDEAIGHFNETVRCSLSGIFYGSYSGDGEGDFIVAIEPQTLEPVGVFQPSDSYDTEWYGISGPQLELRGGEQPVALGAASDIGEFSGVQFTSSFSFDDVSGRWEQDETERGSLLGERFIPSQPGQVIKYVGTYTIPESSRPEGFIQITLTNDGFMVVDWFDTGWSREHHYGQSISDGLVTLDIGDEQYQERYFSFNINNTSGEVINQIVQDNRGNDISLRLSSCRI
ncbi:TPA: hypothetical protein ACN35C_004482 [Vibrio parahaemolyticus]